MIYNDKIAESAIYSGLYTSFIQYVDVSLLSAARSPQIGRETLRAFSDSLSKGGFYRPLFIDPEGGITDGRKRLAAAISLGLRKVPCVVAPTPLVFEDDMLVSRLINDDMTFFEASDALALLTRKHLYSQETAAAAIGRSQSFVANKLRLQYFSLSERTVILDSGLTERHCRALLRISDRQTRSEAMDTIISASLNVAASEDLIASRYLNIPTAQRSFLSVPHRCKQ